MYMKSLFAETDNSIFLIFKIMFLLCFIVLVSCICFVFLPNQITRLQFDEIIGMHNEKNMSLKIVKN